MTSECNRQKEEFKQTYTVKYDKDIADFNT